jgi:hypothetical protein
MQREFTEPNIRPSVSNSTATNTPQFRQNTSGDDVTYVEDMGDTGPTASKVRILEKS